MSEKTRIQFSDKSNVALYEKVNQMIDEVRSETEVVKFSINEASKDTSGNPNFMSIIGEQITFNGAVKYTQADGVVKEYASVSPIALTNGYVMINNGVAEVVPDIYTGQIDSAQEDWALPIMTSGSQDGYSLSAVNFEGTLTDVVNGDNRTGQIYPTSTTVDGSILTITLPSARYINNLKVTTYTREGETYGFKNFKIVSVLNGVETLISDSKPQPEGDGYVDDEFNINNYADSIKFYMSNNGSPKPRLNEISMSGVIIYEENLVFFNPKNNLCRKLNGTDWVDYNGVSVGTITDGVVYNYQYNTQKGIEPFVNVASEETKSAIVGWGMPDYDKDLEIREYLKAVGDTYTIPFDGYLRCVNTASDDVFSAVDDLTDRIIIQSRPYSSPQVRVYKGLTLRTTNSIVSSLNKLYLTPERG